jgi:hypothetical protein
LWPNWAMPRGGPITSSTTRLARAQLCATAQVRYKYWATRHPATIHHLQPWRWGRSWLLKRRNILVNWHGCSPEKILLNLVAVKTSRHITTFDLTFISKQAPNFCK